MLNKHDLKLGTKYIIHGKGFSNFQTGEEVLFKHKINTLYTFSQGAVELSINESKIDDFLKEMDLRLE